MKYCPECGAALTLRREGGRDRQACPSCTFIHFGNYSIGVGGVVVRGGKVLLIQRGQGPGKGWWQIPGGYAEQDESVEAAVVREVLEEAGVRARPTAVVGLRHWVGANGTNVYVIFRLEPEEGEPHADGEETAEARYFTLEEVADLERLYNVNRWAIRAAISPDPGFTRVDAPDLMRPGWVLYGSTGRGIGPPNRAITSAR